MLAENKRVSFEISAFPFKRSRNEIKIIGNRKRFQCDQTTAKIKDEKTGNIKNRSF
jgi:hypothetical protein